MPLNSQPDAVQLAPSHARLAPLRVSTLWQLLTLMVVLVLAASALVMVLVVNPLIRSHAQAAFAASSGAVMSRLDGMQQTTRLTLQEGQRWWRLYQPTVDDPEEFNHFFKPLLSVNQLATSVVAGENNGQGWMLLQEGEGRWRNRFTDVPRWGQAQRIYLYAPDGHIDMAVQSQNYDPRLRPWYVAALSTTQPDDIAWTAPYRFFTTQEPGITASIRLIPPTSGSATLSADGSLNDGALGLDLKLTDLSSLTMSAQVGTHGLALVLTEDERVLALPRNVAAISPGAWADRVLQPPGRLELPEVDAAVALWRRSGRQSLEMQSFPLHGAIWLLSAQPYQLGTQRLWMLSLAPQHDFAPSWTSLLTVVGVALLLLLVPVGWLVSRQVRRVAEPLELLARHSQRIGQLDFAQPAEPVQSSVREIQQLADAHSYMRELLQRRQTQLDEHIAEMEHAQGEIHQLAYFDPLTRLPNRRLLMDRLGQALARCQRHHGTGLLMFIDLDNFKSLNDTLGHAAGDMLLQTLARRLLDCVRQSDTVARLGGDEFLVLLEDCTRSTADAMTEKIRLSLGAPAELQGAEFVITPSIGVVPFGGNEVADDLLKWADMAMYRAKAAGRNGVCFFDPAFQVQAELRVQTEADLRQALRRQELHMWLQPQFNARREVTGAEALVRWQHPQRGWVSPAEFIPVAEAAGLIVPLGEWMLEQACAQLARWADHPLAAGWTLSVNVSARQFRHPGFVAHTLHTLRASGANPQRLRLELTESMLLEDIRQTIERMDALRAMGVGFSLDDFGTGYSSLAYLKRLPFVELKVDQSFVRDLQTDPNDAVLTLTMIVLAHALGLSVLAEGVETETQFTTLVSDGCDLFQGYLLGRPVSTDDFSARWLATESGPASGAGH